jgi:transcription initiation factor IIE alpha subunit
MVQGESGKDKTYWEIQRFLYNNGSAISKEIYENCTCAKATFYKYLDELYEAGNIICKPQRGRGRDLYELSEKAFDKIEEEVVKQKLKEEIDRLPVKQIKSLYEFIDKILMKCVDLTLDKAFMDSLLQGLREGKISKEQIDEVKKKYAEQKEALFTERSYFFTQEEIDQMSRAILAGEESEVMSKKRIEWFEKWFGTLI